MNICHRARASIERPAAAAAAVTACAVVDRKAFMAIQYIAFGAEDKRQHTNLTNPDGRSSRFYDVSSVVEQERHKQRSGSSIMYPDGGVLLRPS